MKEFIDRMEHDELQWTTQMKNFSRTNNATPHVSINNISHLEDNPFKQLKEDNPFKQLDHDDIKLDADHGHVQPVVGRDTTSNSLNSLNSLDSITTDVPLHQVANNLSFNKMDSADDWINTNTHPLNKETNLAIQNLHDNLAGLN